MTEWPHRCLDTAFACATLASAIGMDRDSAWVAGLLHDIGLSSGSRGISHAFRGRQLLLELGEPALASVCLTHHFPSGRLEDWPGIVDVDPDEVREALAASRPGELDRVVQLCAVLADREGAEAARALYALEPDGSRTAYWFALSALRARFEARAGRSLSLVFGDAVRREPASGLASRP